MIKCIIKRACARVEEGMESKGEIVIYQMQDGTTQLDVRLDGETVWITQDQMTQLFQLDKSTISRHIKNIFEDGELDESLVVAKNATHKKYGRREGFVQETETTFYNLDVIISVGYRVKSQRGVQFRQWASRELSLYACQNHVLTVNTRMLPLFDQQSLHFVYRVNEEYIAYKAAA